jgi:hypothetical protein
MWTKIYLALLALSLGVMAFFTFYSLSWLQSIGDPRAAAAGFDYHSTASWPFLWISAIALLIIGNAVLWTARLSWAMWLSFVYIAAFIAIKFFWLDQAFSTFQTTHGLTASGISFGPFFAVMMIVVLAAIVIFNQFFAVRMYEKIYTSKTNAVDPEPTSDAE